MKASTLNSNQYNFNGCTETRSRQNFWYNEAHSLSYHFDLHFVMTISFHGTLLFWSGAIMPVDRFTYPLLFLPHNDVVDFAGSAKYKKS